MRTLLATVLFLRFYCVNGQNYHIEGTIQDGENQLPLTGVNLRIEGTNIKTSSNLDGTYLLKNIQAGNYILRITFPGYKERKEALNVQANTRLDYQLNAIEDVMRDITIRVRRAEDNEASARATEKLTMKVMNVVSGREIELSPDITVANVVQRISGVSLERNNNGDGQYAIVRGMDKRYNYTLVNGIKIPSPEAKNRYVPLDIFPSDLLDRLEVTKALTPNMEGDAIGGVIDMKMKQAPNHFVMHVNVGTGFNQLFNDRPFRTFDNTQVNMQSPHQQFGRNYRAKTDDFSRNNMVFRDREPGSSFIQAPINQILGFSIGNRFFDGRLGVLFAGSYQNTYRGANSLLMTTFIDQEKNTPYYEILQLREFSVQQERAGAHLRLDYRFNKRNNINLYAGYINLTDREVRYRIDTIMKIGRGQGPGTGRVELRERSRQQFRNVYNATLQGTHKLRSDWELDWSAVYSLAVNNDPDMTELQWLTGVTRDTTGNYNVEPQIYNRDFSRRWTSNSDGDLAGYANIKHTTQIKGYLMEISAGGMYRHKNRDNVFHSYLFRTAPINQTYTGDVKDYSFELFNTLGTPNDPLNYYCQENVLGVYTMANTTIGKLNILGGVRFENTAFSWETQAPVTVKGRVGNILYSDLLPSLHFKYSPNKKQNIRATYFSSISRPNFFEVIPYEINEEDFRERGNPGLKHTEARNADFRYENFFNLLDKFMGGIFYKRIINPIEAALIIDGQTVVLQPYNFGSATNYGLELDFVKYIKRFGVRAFYTYTDSRITTSKIVRFRDAQGNLTSRNEDQTRPLQGQSKHISNISLLYKNPKQGTDMQLAFVYTGSRIISVSPYLNNDIWQRAFIQLDFSAEQKVTKDFVFYVKINNMLNTPFRADILLPNTFNPEQAPYLDATKSVKVREDFYMQTFFFGVKYKLNPK
jgi:outer membrane cobalamin receptor